MDREAHTGCKKAAAKSDVAAAFKSLLPLCQGIVIPLPVIGTVLALGGGNPVHFVLVQIHHAVVAVVLLIVVVIPAGIALIRFHGLFLPDFEGEIPVFVENAAVTAVLGDGHAAGVQAANAVNHLVKFHMGVPVEERSEERR